MVLIGALVLLEGFPRTERIIAVAAFMLSVPLLAAAVSGRSAPIGREGARSARGPGGF
jgi:hypothetical protein